jgi:hypothetical protein
MNRRHALSTAAVLLPWPAVQASDGFTLVTESLAQAEREHDERLGSPPLPPPRRTRSLFPAIKVVAPRASRDDLVSPLRIELLFETSPDARIVPASFRVLYGMLKFDLTDNVRQNATLSERGLLAEKASVPKGSHRLFLQIADDKGRVAEQELRVKVGG